MKRLFVLLTSAFGVGFYASAQAIQQGDVTRIVSTLASDEMRGRRAGTPDIDRAAAFIADEFKKAGLQTLNGNGYLQQFKTLRPKLKELKVKMADQDVDAKSVVVITSKPELNVTEKSGFKVVKVATPEEYMALGTSISSPKENTIVLVDSSLSRNFSRAAGATRQMFVNDFSTILILGSTLPQEFKIKLEQDIEEVPFANVVGVLPGKSKKNEQVIFSGHYDHLGVGKPVDGDSIYNGANDDAAGTTAVIALAKHFAQQKDNERTLVFVAFTAEEMGMWGSRYFSQQMNPEAVVAMFNIEMIGTESKWGKNSAYITGFERSSMGEILQQNLKGSSFTFHPDPYTKENLFLRSDNATLARMGVPAHTISTSQMDAEPHYHKASDEVSTLDLANMTEIIIAIAESSKTIVSGKDTPTRVKF